MKPERTIVLRTRGERDGPITNFVRPSEIGRLIKPFIFLDYLDTQIEGDFGFGFHPHSGIATLTHQLLGDVAYEDTSGQKGIVRAGGIEWMLGGGGVWHQGHLSNTQRGLGFQLWLALPPGAEDGPSQGIYVGPDDVQRHENVRVLLGEYESARSSIPTPSPINYFYITLAANEHWHFVPPREQSVAWVFVHTGRVSSAGLILADELAVYEESDQALNLLALEDSGILVGTAVKHRHELIVGPHSVHTNRESLNAGARRIEQIGARLQSEGRLT